MTDAETTTPAPRHDDEESRWTGGKLVGIAVLTLLFGISVIYFMASAAQH